MGQEGPSLILATFAAFGVVSIILYLLVIRPAFPSDPPADTPRRSTIATNQNDRGANRGRARDARAATANANSLATPLNSSTMDKILLQCANFPVHVAGSSRSTRGRSLVVEGLVPFRHTRASEFEQGKGDGVAESRKERARVLSRLLELEGRTSEHGASPPTRGGTIIVSVPYLEVACPKMRRVLYLLATYYNLLLIVVVPPAETANDDVLLKATDKLRGQESGEGRLDEECLPSHRIVAATTAAGRVAFVRQLAKVEVVLDFDSEVKTQLARFGYRVINYKRQNSHKTLSQLGVCFSDINL